MKRCNSSYKPYKYAGRVLVLAMVACVLWGCGKRPLSPGIAPAAVEDRQYADAEKLFRAGDYDNALAQYQAYVAQFPHRPFSDDALMKIASIYAVRGRYQDARDQYQRVLDEYPDSVSAANAKVEIPATYYHQGDYSGFFERVKSVNVDSLPRPSRLRLYKLMGDAYLSSGHAKEAVSAYATSLSYYEEKGRPETTPEMIKAIGELAPGDFEELLSGPDYLPKAYLMYHLGLSNLKEGWDQAAKDALDKYIRTYPDHEFSDDARQLLDSLEQKTRYDRLSLGCLLPLTGPYSGYGNRALHGVELCFSRFRLNHPDIPVKLIVKDTGSEESQAIQAVRELNEAKVAAIIGPIVMAKPAAEEAQRFGIPIITLSQKDDIIGIGGYVFRNFLTPRTQVDTMVSYLSGALGLKRFAILYPDNSYGRFFMNLF